MAKKIVFYTEVKWAFGQIHYSLCRHLMPYVECEVLDFFTKYHEKEMEMIDKHTDIFVTTPVGAGWLLNYHIDPKKIYAVAHGQWDILVAKSGGLDFHSLGDYGVISNILKTKSKEFGISRVPSVLPLGIDTDRYYQPHATELKLCGFGGAYESRNFTGQEIKRGSLVSKTVSEAKMQLLVAKDLHYLAMPGFYGMVDCVLNASLEEGGGLPMMEAAASGRLPLGTPVGYFEEFGADFCEEKSGGIHLPIDELEYTKVGSRILEHYSKYPQEFSKKCKLVQEFAMEKYDWDIHKREWIRFIES